MIYVLPGSHAVNIVTILSVAGEFSSASSRLLGNEALIRRTIRSMCKPQEILMGDMKYSGQLLSVSGRGALKSVRLRKWAYPVLKELEADEYYKKTFGSKRFTGCIKNKDRNYRVAECLMMFLRSGIEFRPYMLPKLQNQEMKIVVPIKPSFYLAKDLKKLDKDSLPKTQFTRVTGMLFIGRKPYAVYNTRGSLMKWNGAGENKTIENLQSIARMNAARDDLDAAIMFYGNEKTAIDTVRDIRANEHLDLGFINIYQKIHFIPLGDIGVRQLQLFLRPKWWEKVISYLFEDNGEPIGYFNHDAVIDGMEILCFLDGDVTRLIRFKNAVMTNKNRFGIVCFPHQEKIIKEFFEIEIPLTVVSMEKVEKIISGEAE